MYIMLYIYICISADLSRASSVLDYTSLPTTSSPFQIPTLEARTRRGHQFSQSATGRPRLPGVLAQSATGCHRPPQAARGSGPVHHRAPQAAQGSGPESSKSP